MVDGARHENPDSTDRDYQHLTFDAFMDVTIGLNMDGTALTEESRYEIAKLSIYDWTIVTPPNDIGM